MTIAGKDRRGLGEIVTLASILVVLGGVVIAELFITHTASTELIVVLAGIGAAQGARGVQSAMERSASSEQRNHESSEMRQVVSELRRELEELRRTNDVNRLLALTGQHHKERE
jgi:hypothetical protein